MIILILIMAVLLFSAAMILQPSGHSRNWTIFLSFLLMAVSILVISLNDNQHLGMHQTSTTEIVALAPTHQLGTKQLGTGNEKIYLYTSLLDPHKLQHTPADSKSQVTIKRTNSAAKLHIVTNRWHYSNSFWRLLVGIGGENNKLASRQFIFVLPNSWQIKTIR